MNTNNIRKVLLALLGLVVIALALFFSGVIANSKVPYQPKKQDTTKQVLTQIVSNGSVSVSLPANGLLQAVNRVELTARVQGVLQPGAHLFRAGTSYKKGEVLLKVDASEYQAGVLAQRANFYNQVTALLPDLKLDFPNAYNAWSNYTAQWSINSPTPKLPEFTDSGVKNYITGRGVVAAYYALKAQEQNLDFYTVRAPFDGVLVNAQVTEGSLIRPGQSLGTFIGTGDYELAVSVAPSYAAQLKTGATVQLHALDGSQNYTGVVKRINQSVDATTQSIRVFIGVRSTALAEGVYLNADLQAQAIDNAFALDRGLVTADQQVFSVVDNQLKLIDVQVVHYAEKQAVVRGIPDGTVVLAKPLVGAFEGMPVLHTASVQ
jgi:membrane fusion protein (multidrug efflux system)